jgi:hypothetical protein
VWISNPFCPLCFLGVFNTKIVIILKHACWLHLTKTVFFFFMEWDWVFDDVLPGWAYLVTAYAVVLYVTWSLWVKQLFVKLHLLIKCSFTIESILDDRAGGLSDLILLCIFVYCVTSLTDADCSTFLWELQDLQHFKCMMGIALLV